MARKYLLPMILLWVAVAGCDGPQTTATPARVSTAPSTRPVEIPAVDVHTPATTEDFAAARAVASDPAIRKAIDEHVGPMGRGWEIYAARFVGDYALLWVTYPDVADGGSYLVYSKKEQRVGWTFKGGQRANAADRRAP